MVSPTLLPPRALAWKGVAARRPKSGASCGSGKFSRQVTRYNNQQVAGQPTTLTQCGAASSRYPFSSSQCWGPSVGRVDTSGYPCAENSPSGYCSFSCNDYLEPYKKSGAASDGSVETHYRLKVRARVPVAATPR